MGFLSGYFVAKDGTDQRRAIAGVADARLQYPESPDLQSGRSEHQCAELRSGWRDAQHPENHGVWLALPVLASVNREIFSLTHSSSQLTQNSQRTRCVCSTGVRSISP